MATGEIRYIATIDTSKYKSGQLEIEKANNAVEKSTINVEKSQNALQRAVEKYGAGSLQARDATANLNSAQLDLADSNAQLDKAISKNSTSLNLFKAGLAAVAAAAVAVGAVIVSNIGGAITRIDTLNNSARVFKNLGFEANDVAEAMSNLQASILGLPTSLDAAVRGTQDLAATYGDIRLGQRVFSALNNAILSTGGSAEEVNNAIRQLSQVPLDGPLDAQTWLSLRNSGLTPVLVTLSKEFGRSIDQLKEDFSSGTLTVQDFVDGLLKLDSEGGSGVASLQTQVRDATNGIGTSFTNLNTAIVRNIGNIISAFGVDRIAGGIRAFTQVINDIGKVIGDIVTQYVVPFTQKVGDLFSIIYSNEQVLKGMQYILIAIGVALGTVVAVIGIALIAFGALFSAIAYSYGLIQDVFTNITNVVRSFVTFVVLSISSVIGHLVQVFSSIPSFFQNLWTQIVSSFTNIGVAVGNAIGNAVKSVVNSVLRTAVNLINGFIDGINGVINLINALPGVDIGRLGRLPIPQLANGGIVLPTPGGTIANIAEAGQAEAVIPLDRLDEIIKTGGGNSGAPTIEINISGAIVSSPQDQRRFAEVIGKRLNEIMQQKGYAPAIEGI